MWSWGEKVDKFGITFGTILVYTLCECTVWTRWKNVTCQIDSTRPRPEPTETILDRIMLIRHILNPLQSLVYLTVHKCEIWDKKLDNLGAFGSIMVSSVQCLRYGECENSDLTNRSGTSWNHWKRPSNVRTRRNVPYRWCWSWVVQPDLGRFGADLTPFKSIWRDLRVYGSIWEDYVVPGAVSPLWGIRNFWLDQSIGDVLNYLETTLECPNQAERSSDHALIMCDADRFAQDSVNLNRSSHRQATTSASPCRSYQWSESPVSLNKVEVWTTERTNIIWSVGWALLTPTTTQHCPSAAPIYQPSHMSYLGRREAYSDLTCSCGWNWHWQRSTAHLMTPKPMTNWWFTLGAKTVQTPNVTFSGGRLNTHELHTAVSNQKNSEGVRWIRLDTVPIRFSDRTSFVCETVSDVDAYHVVHAWMSRK